MHTPFFWYRPFGWQAALLWPLSLAYRCGRRLHVLLGKARSVPRPVICVGNLVAGGAGKTPTVLALAALLADVRPHLVTRGFGGSHISNSAAPHRVTAKDTAAEVGDEALLLAEVAPAWVARDRRLGLGCAFAAGAGLVLLDDGLQSVRFRARVNLLVVDGASGFGNGAALPAGPLRELPAAARGRVDALVMIGADAHASAALFPGVPVFRADPRYDLAALDKGARYLAFAGLARPEKFFAAAQAQGLALAEAHPFADHHPYTPEERSWLLAEAREAKAQLLTTAKDAMRWPVLQRMALSILPLQLCFADPAALRAFLESRCGEAFAGAFDA